MLQPELRADFGWTELEAELAGAGADLFVRRQSPKAESVNRCHYKINLGFLIRAFESGRAKNVMCAIRDRAPCCLERRAEIVGCRVTGAELDGFPNSEGRGGGHGLCVFHRKPGLHHVNVPLGLLFLPQVSHRQDLQFVADIAYEVIPLGERENDHDPGHGEA